MKNILILFVGVMLSLSGCGMIGDYNEKSILEKVELEVDGEEIYVGTLDKSMIRGGNLSLASDTELEEEDFLMWHEWGVNTLRINFNKDDLLNVFSDAPTADDLFKPYRNNMIKMENWIVFAKKYDIQINITLDYIWGDDHDSNKMWSNGGDNKYLTHRLELAGAMAEWVKVYDNVNYLCPWNEMYPYNDVYHEWFVDEVVKEIRSVNDKITIVLMPPGAWGDIKNFEIWDGVDDDNTIYAVNLYDPYTYTHQGLYEEVLTEEGWPGNHQVGATPEETKYMDIELVREFLSVISDFKERTGKEVIVTEIGVVRWAKDKETYISDVLTVLEENKIGWIFHSVAGWNGWNPSYDGDEEVAVAPYSGHETSLLKVLKRYWELNKMYENQIK